MLKLSWKQTIFGRGLGCMPLGNGGQNVDSRLNELYETYTHTQHSDNYLCQLLVQGVRIICSLILEMV